MNPEIQKVLDSESEGCIVCKDCRYLDLPDNCIDTIITDAPYGYKFMGKDWDHGVPGEYFWEIALRAAKPGAILMSFGGTRTHHRLMCAIEDAGWEIRDCMMWLYGSGFPKSLDISKAIDKASIITCPVCNGDGRARINGRDVGVCLRCDGECVVRGAEREAGRVRTDGRGKWEIKCQREKGDTGIGHYDGSHQVYTETIPATDLAKQWDGYGTALKPAYELIIVAMKPCEGTFAQNAEKWGVAGLWIDGGRIGFKGESDEREAKNKNRHADFESGPMTNQVFGKYARDRDNYDAQGRWPANVILDEQAGAMLDEMSGNLAGGTGETKIYGEYHNDKRFNASKQVNRVSYKGSGGASRFFYCAKASRKERGEGNNHPTVKPLALIEYLCKLTKTPTGGIVLDMFGGSGTTALACINTGRRYIVAEKRADYHNIAQNRVKEMRAGQQALFK